MCNVWQFQNQYFCVHLSPSTNCIGKIETNQKTLMKPYFHNKSTHFFDANWALTLFLFFNSGRFASVSITFHCFYLLSKLFGAVNYIYGPFWGFDTVKHEIYKRCVLIPLVSTSFTFYRSFHHYLAVKVFWQVKMASSIRSFIKLLRHLWTYRFPLYSTFRFVSDLSMVFLYHMFVSWFLRILAITESLHSVALQRKLTPTNPVSPANTLQVVWQGSSSWSKKVQYVKHSEKWANG